MNDKKMLNYIVHKIVKQIRKKNKLKKQETAELDNQTGLPRKQRSQAFKKTG